jgi:hypothetical protein
MTANLSPKMQELVTKLEAGTQVIINHFGHFHTYEVRDNGTTWGSTRANPTVKALISRGIVAQNAAGEWVLASTIETAETETPVEAQVRTVKPSTPTRNQVIVLAHFTKPTTKTLALVRAMDGRAYAASRDACKRKGWIESTDSFPYSRVTEDGETAIRDWIESLRKQEVK